jgi:hypothetical protein
LDRETNHYHLLPALKILEYYLTFSITFRGVAWRQTAGQQHQFSIGGVGIAYEETDKFSLISASKYHSTSCRRECTDKKFETVHIANDSRFIEQEDNITRLEYVYTSEIIY